MLRSLLNRTKSACRVRFAHTYILQTSLIFSRYGTSNTHYNKTCSWCNYHLQNNTMNWFLANKKEKGINSLDPKLIFSSVCAINPFSHHHIFDLSHNPYQPPSYIYQLCVTHVENFKNQ